MTSCPEVKVLVNYNIGKYVSLNNLIVGGDSIAKRAAISVTLTVNANLDVKFLNVSSGSTLILKSTNKISISNDATFNSTSTYQVTSGQGTMIAGGCIYFIDPVSVVIEGNQNSDNWSPYTAGCTKGKPACKSSTGESIECTFGNINNVGQNQPPSLGWIAAVIVGVLLIIAVIIFVGRRILSRKHSDPEEIPDPPFEVVALSDYMAVDASQMTLIKGNHYHVIKIDEGHHWFQSKQPNGKLGWFPASYVRITGSSYGE